MILAGWITLAVSRSPAEPPAPRGDDLFEIHVRPLLLTHCITCHGETKQESGLQLTSLDALLKGGDSGPALVPGDPVESLLLEALRYESYEMPPDGPLDEQAIAGVEQWIAAGAPWPSGAVLRPAPPISDEDRNWWCFQPVVDPPVPEVADGGWSRNEIDRFIFARLADEKISPAPEADPVQLARRVHFAVAGLPPDESTVRAACEGTESYESLVDRLLDDPAYGENQARHWLDLVRYADSDGYNADHLRPEAHHYRDYVIRSFNADKPYDRFVAEQLAGDEIDPGNRDALIATMYLRHGIYEWNQRDVEQQWQEMLNDVTETTADVFLAQGLKCARCHDHKFDPLLQRDFYRLKAFFAALHLREDMPIADVRTRASYFQAQRTWEQKTDDTRRRLFEIEHPVLLEHSSREGVVKFVDQIKSMLYKRPGERTAYEHQIASLASRQFDVHPEKLPEWLGDEEAAERQALCAQLAQFEALKPEPPPTLSFVASDVGSEAPPTFITDDPEKAAIAPGFPTILDDAPADVIVPDPALQSTGRRTALARWITDPANPLTARVIVNRIWQQHFGRGLAEPVSDFGRLGQPPTHPELLDWLASRLVEEGWSIKALHRRILTSAVYRQSSQRPISERLAAIDPENRLLWRMRPRRLSGEEITDAILSASGELTTERRAIYKPVRRNHLDPLLSAFDFPDRIRSNGQRHRTTTPTQALLLTNGSWAEQRVGAMTERLASTPDDQFVQSAYVALCGRPAHDGELTLAQNFLEAYAKLPGDESPQVPPAEATSESGRCDGPSENARGALVHALLNSSEFVYVD